MQELYFKVADLPFKVTVPENWDFAQLLPAFDAFYTQAYSEEELLFSADFNNGALSEEEEEKTVVVSSDNDMGHLELQRTVSHYWGELYFEPSKQHRWVSDKEFRFIQARVNESDAWFSQAVTSILRLAFSQSILGVKGISIHSSCVSLDNKGYLFLGKSGTGKSTHARMWLQAFKEAELLNDDNPALRIVDGECHVYGTPWSGKTPCYKQRRLPVQAIVRLEQAPRNAFQPMDEIEAFSAVLPSCSVIQSDENLQDLLYDTLIEITSTVKVGWMKCLPCPDAAICCAEGIKNMLSE